MSQSTSSGHAAPAPSQSIGAARLGIAVSTYHQEITQALLDGCLKTLVESGASASNIITLHAPGAFELPSTAQLIIDRYRPDAVICLGCVVKGDTRHDEYINHAVASGVMHLSLTHKVPVIFGVLTTENMDQARERAGGSEGHKGIEAALAAISMIKLKA